MMVYEDWSINKHLIDLPTLTSNPSVTFAGVVRGLRYRCRDLGQPDADGEARAHAWIRAFGRSREGRAYRPWTERFLDGRLPVSFGDDPRERWWRLVHLETRLGVLELRARQDADAAASARALRGFVDRLQREIGRPFHMADDEAGAARVNDLGRADLLRLLDDAQIPARDAVADDVLAR